MEQFQTIIEIIRMDFARDLFFFSLRKGALSSIVLLNLNPDESLHGIMSIIGQCLLLEFKDEVVKTVDPVKVRLKIL